MQNWLLRWRRACYCSTDCSLNATEKVSLATAKQKSKEETRLEEQVPDSNVPTYKLCGKRWHHGHAKLLKRLSWQTQQPSQWASRPWLRPSRPFWNRTCNPSINWGLFQEEVFLVLSKKITMMRVGTLDPGMLTFSERHRHFPVTFTDYWLARDGSRDQEHLRNAYLKPIQQTAYSCT